MTPEAFAEQMALLAERGFTPINTADLAARWRSGRPLPARPRADHVRRRLRGRAPARACRCSPSTASRPRCSCRRAGSRGPYDTGGGLDTMLDWDQVRELAGAGVEIGGHSHTHPQLDQLDDDALRFELTALPGDRRRANWAPRRSSFAYPYGYSSRRVRRVGAGGRVRPGARRRQRPRAGAARGRTPCDGSPCAGRTGIEEFARLVEGRSIARDLRQGPGPHQGVRHGPQSTTGPPEGHPFPCLTRRPHPDRPDFRGPRHPSSVRAPAAAAPARPRPGRGAAASCSATPTP